MSHNADRIETAGLKLKHFANHQDEIELAEFAIAKQKFEMHTFKVRSGFMALLFSLIFAMPAYAGVLMQGFYWDAYDANQSWWNLLASRSSELSQSGFTAVWIPPVLKSASGPFSNGYDPYDDYDIGSKDQRGTYGTHWGTREELQRSVAVMRANGLDVYLDTVLGHRNGDSGDSHFVYRDAWGNQTGGRFEKWPDYFSGNNPFGRALNLMHPFVKDKVIAAGDWLINALGVQGLRIDYAAGVDTVFLNEYLGRDAMGSMFAVAEYWSENVDELDHYVHHRMRGRVSAFDFPLWGRLKDMSNAGGAFDMRELTRAGLIRRSPDRSVTFVENHDTDKNYPTHKNKHLGYAFILTSEGYPSVFWKDYFNYGMKSVIDPLIWIHEKLAGGGTTWRWSDEDLLIYERGRGLLVGLNDNPVAERSEWVQTNFGGFVWLHDYTGHGPDIRTEGDGRVRVPVKANSYVAYAPAGRSDAHILRSHSVRQQFAGAKDLDIPPAVAGKWNSVGRIWVDQNQRIDIGLYQEARNEDGAFKLRILGPNKQQLQQFEFSLREGLSRGQVQSQGRGWYKFEIILEGTKPETQELPFWLNVNYQPGKG